MNNSSSSLPTIELSQLASLPCQQAFLGWQQLLLHPRPREISVQYCIDGSVEVEYVAALGRRHTRLTRHQICIHSDGTVSRPVEISRQLKQPAAAQSC